MAIKSTIFKASLQIADIDHGYYADHPFTLARHPSETDERMMVRLAALALQAHQLHRLCHGDATLAFGAGLSDPDDPDVSLTHFTGRKRLWAKIGQPQDKRLPRAGAKPYSELGQPEDNPLTRACGKADAVLVYCYHHAADIWWQGIAPRLSRLDKLQVWRIPS